jgi:hypothetical protein
VFLAFQYPVEIPGVSNLYFLRAALNGIRKQQGLGELDAFDFMEEVRGKVKMLGMPEDLMSRAVNLYARWLLGLSASDCSGAFRCYRVSTLARLDFHAIRSRGYSFQEEILWRLKRLGARFGETPIAFVDRRKGSSKIDPKEAAAALWIIFRLGVENLARRSQGPVKQ